MTKAQIQKIAKANGLDISLISIRKCSGTIRLEMADLPADLAKRNIEYYYENCEQLPEVEKTIKKYNQQAKKLLAVMGLKHWGLKTGTGAWDYELGEMSYSTRLALYNID